jgi:hypothetical protein
VSPGRYRCGIKMHQLVEHDANVSSRTGGLWNWFMAKSAPPRRANAS